MTRCELCDELKPDLQFSPSEYGETICDECLMVVAQLNEEELPCRN